MNSVLVLYRDIRFDSRPKRAIEYLSQIGNVTLVHKSCDLNVEYSKTTFIASNPISFVFRIFTAVRSEQSNKLIYSIGILSLLLSIPAKLISGKFLIYDSRELYLKGPDGNSTYTWKHRLLEKLLINFVDAVICANPERMSFMMQHYGKPRHYSYLRNIPLFDFHAHSKQNNEIKKIVYQGHLGQKRGLDKFINILSHLKIQFEVIFIIPANSHDILINYLKGVNFKWSILPFMPLKDLYKKLSECDLGYVAYELHGPNNIFCEPNKLYEYANVNLKILSSPQPIFQNIFQRFPIGLSLTESYWNSNDYKSMANEVEFILSKHVKDDEFDNFKSEFSKYTEITRFKKFVSALPI